MSFTLHRAVVASLCISLFLGCTPTGPGGAVSSGSDDLGDSSLPPEAIPNSGSDIIDISSDSPGPRVETIVDASATEATANPTDDDASGGSSGEDEMSDGSPDAVPGPPFDAGEGGVCPTRLGPGDLSVTELMIESVAGTGDHGEWIEITSSRACALNLHGLHAEAPAGSKVHIVDIDDDTWIPAFGTFVIADSTDPAFNHSLPGLVLAWTGQPGDVLRNKGATVTLEANGLLVTSVTYPALKLTVGRSWAFPADCTPDHLSDWMSWQISTASWFPAFFGTPNAPNSDVHCPDSFQGNGDE
jgi:hypothetical protein